MRFPWAAQPIAGKRGLKDEIGGKRAFGLRRRVGGAYQEGASVYQNGQ